MRKIAQQIAQAIKDGKSRTIGNTRYDAQSGAVFLHGYRILYRSSTVGFQDSFLIDIETCKRWPTRTTCSRVNDVVNCMTGYGDGTRIHVLSFVLMVDMGKAGKSYARDMNFDPYAFSNPHHNRCNNGTH